jgi:hypothetical protein
MGARPGCEAQAGEERRRQTGYGVCEAGDHRPRAAPQGEEKLRHATLEEVSEI